MSVLQSTERAVRRRSRARRLLVVAAATLAPMAVVAVATAVGVELRVVMPGKPAMTIGQPMIFVAGLLSSLAGWAVLAVLERLTRRAHPIWIALAAVVLLVSMAPIAQAEASAATRSVLAATHVVVAAVLVPGLLRAHPRRSIGGPRDDGATGGL